MNFQSELFFRNVLRKQYLFLPTGQLSKSKEKRKNKKECFLWATHHTPGYTHQWEFIPSYQVSSIKYRPLPQWFHLNQYALFINIKLLRRISSKSLLKLTFHISKWVIHILSTVSLESQQASGFGSVGITKETDYSPTYLAINSHLLFLLSFIQIMWLFSRCALCVKKKKKIVFGLELYKITLFPAVWQVRCPEWLSQ